MALRPLQDYVLIRPIHPEEERIGGIVIPDTAKERPTAGEVLAIGPGRIRADGTHKPPEVKIGDRVIFGRYVGTEITIDNEELLILREADLDGVLLEGGLPGKPKPPPPPASSSR